MTDLAKLKEAAEKATPGPWKAFKATNGLLIGIGESTGEGIMDPFGGLWRGGPEAVANAEHVSAADPSTVLKMVAVVEAALTCRDAWIAEAKTAGKALDLDRASGMLCDYEAKLVLACQPFTGGQ